jgi:hypothetical protein
MGINFREISSVPMPLTILPVLDPGRTQVPRALYRFFTVFSTKKALGALQKPFRPSGGPTDPIEIVQ